MTLSNGQANAVNRVILNLAGKPSPSGQVLTARGAAADLAFLAESAYRQILCGARTPEAEEAIAAVERIRETAAARASAIGDISDALAEARKLVDELREQLATAAAAERVRLIGDEDTDELGLLDHFQVFAERAPNGKDVVWARCMNPCGEEGNGTLLVLARDLEGSQTGLTLAELAHQALRHWQEEHP